MSDTLQEELDDEITEIPWSEMDDQEQYGVIEAAVTTLASQLEEDGADPDLITAVLFNAFTQRLADINDREQYEMILSGALEEEWETVQIH